MVGMYLQQMYPANATEVTAMVHDATEVEKKWIVEQSGGLKRWLANKDVVKTYSQPRIYRIKDEEPVSKNKISITMYGMANNHGISNIPEVVEARGTRKRNTKTVSELILESEYKTRDGLKPSPFTKREKQWY